MHMPPSRSKTRSVGNSDNDADGSVDGIVDVVLVTAQRCHFCEDAKRLLAGLAPRFPLTIRFVDIESGEGMELLHRFVPPFPPLLLLNGQRFGHGRISRRKLVRALTAITDVSQTQDAADV